MGHSQWHFLFGIKITLIVIELGGDHEVGSLLYFGIDKRRGKYGIAARILWFFWGG